MQQQRLVNAEGVQMQQNIGNPANQVTEQKQNISQAGKENVTFMNIMKEASFKLINLLYTDIDIDCSAK